MSKIKEILCLHHSHLDIGYTHPQYMLLELQCDYIDQAIDLCIQTADWPEESRFRWTCEATYPLMKWLKTAPPDRVVLFQRLVKDGYISVSAMPMHTTPGCTVQQLTQVFQQLDQIRELTNSRITTAINHDINGQPWTMASLLLDSNIVFYITGINIHFGGLPFPRPYIFNWDTQDGRSLPTFLGEHYSLFSQFFFTFQGSTEKMHSGIQEYVNRIEASSWQEDFVYLTATNPPLFDNNCPDAGLADLIRRYNAEGHEQTIRFVTPEMLYERILQSGLEKLPHHAGDWTDYWNFGSASTARELKFNRHAKDNLSKADFLTCFSREPSTSRYRTLTQQAYEDTVLFDEHTWGASESVLQPDQDETYAQLNHKKDFAYIASDLSSYLLSTEMERAARNPLQSDRQDGLYIVNPTAFSLEQELCVPAQMLTPGRTLAALRMKDYLPYERNESNQISLGSITMAPFSAKRIPFSALSEKKGCADNVFAISETRIDTPFYRISLAPSTGRILQIQDIQTGHNLLGSHYPWSFFDLVEEHIDPRYAKASRKAFFPRDVEKGNRNISQWVHNWKAIHEGVQELLDYHVQEAPGSITLRYHFRSHSLASIEQEITFFSTHPRISLDACLTKLPSTEPESLYFAFPLALNEGWECCYDSAASFVRLDDEQLGNVCRDYVTVDKTISLFDNTYGYTLACPDAPMVQIGGFHFGKERRQIERIADPLLLAWPLNNYWDTNFAFSQEGKMSFHYELSTFTSFHTIDAYKAGLIASSPCAVGAAVECAEESEETFLCCKGEDCAPLFLRPQFRKEGLLMAVKNFRKKENSCTISFPGKSLSFAAITDIQGNTRKILHAEENCLSLSLDPEAITFLRICF